jgi:hypothetical protein
MAFTKDHILREIRSTARDNGGVPLGQMRFYKETGIKQADWIGRYWTRWSDAIREAGHEPNKMQGAADEAALLEKYIALTRQLGRFPVSAELRLQRRLDPAFPSHNVWSDRFGPKPDLLQRVVTYCRSRGGCDDIIELYEAHKQPMRRKAPRGEQTSGLEEGFVYLMGLGPRYKLGRTNSIGRRQRQNQTGSPDPLPVAHYIRTDDTVGIEEYWHKRFAASRKFNEWFELTPRDVQAFRRRKFM